MEIINFLINLNKCKYRIFIIILLLFVFSQENGTPVDPIVNPLPNSGIESFTSGGISARQSRNYDNFNHSHQYSSLSKRKLNSRSYSMSPGRV